MKNNFKDNTRLIFAFLPFAIYTLGMQKVTNEAPGFQLTETQTPTLWCQHKEMNTQLQHSILFKIQRL